MHDGREPSRPTAVVKDRVRFPPAFSPSVKQGTIEDDGQCMMGLEPAVVLQQYTEVPIDVILRIVHEKCFPSVKQKGPAD